jgi:exosortase A
VNRVRAALTPRESLWAAGFFGVLLILLYGQTTLSMVSIWARSDTFAHGFLILPITLWLIWNRREYLAPLQPAPAPLVTLLLIPGAIAWLLAWVVDVLVVQQLAMVGMLVVGAWAILGHRLGACLAFPLGFLFFAVPIGEGLIDPMMEFTATTTVALVRATGIPVYREGLYFSLPTGNWSVVEACSGVRYIIASLTVGTLFAYLTYRSWWRRALFILISGIVPVFANTVRAYIIVMLGHLSDMSIATGADHLVYGWAFFGVVIFILFWLGAFFREDLEPLPSRQTAPPAGGDRLASRAGLAVTFALALACAALGPLLASNFSAAGSGPVRAPDLPAPAKGWRTADGAGFAWQPASRVGGLRQAVYSLDGGAVTLTVQYADQSFGTGEVIGSNRFFAWDEGGWQVIGSGLVATGTSPESAAEALVRGRGGEFMAWSWYQVGGRQTTSDYVAKLGQTAGAFGVGREGIWRVIVAAPIVREPDATRALLRAFIDQHGSAIDNALRAAVGS